MVVMVALASPTRPKEVVRQIARQFHQYTRQSLSHRPYSDPKNLITRAGHDIRATRKTCRLLLPLQILSRMHRVQATARPLTAPRDTARQLPSMLETRKSQLESHQNTSRALNSAELRETSGHRLTPRPHAKCQMLPALLDIHQLRSMIIHIPPLIDQIPRNMPIIIRNMHHIQLHYPAPKAPRLKTSDLSYLRLYLHRARLRRPHASPLLSVRLMG